MGGRGGASGFSDGNKSGMISISDMPKLTGSDKQINWAEKIRENAASVVNNNINLHKSRIKQYGDIQEYKDGLEAFTYIGKQLGEELKKIDSASVLINRRETFSPNRIIDLAGKLEEAYRRKRRK